MTLISVIEVPQWRSSGSRTAERLVEGARLLAEMVPGGDRVRVEVAEGSTPAELAVTASRVRAARDGAQGFPVTLGGDCGVDLEPIAAAVRRYGERLVVLWFDAHGDLNTPDTSPSGAFHGMVLRALTGEGHRELLPEVSLDPRRIVLAGARDLDAAEVSFIEERGVRHLRVEDLAGTDALPDAVAQAGTDALPDAVAQGGTDALPDGVARAGADALLDAVARAGDGEVAVYVHIDLDVLDPGEFASVGAPARGGLRAGQLLGLVEAVAGRFEIAGLGITEYEPNDPGDQATLTPLVAALVKTCTQTP
ncbi:arginase family protein [Nonomuraea sp. NPDC050394]|uniref:arginase family protein n=1 Tax=Nonomuraea sp. NPDC050394 TaxID=3364363 RepID=UPI003797B83C